MRDWPLPFAGIRLVIDCKSSDELLAFLGYIGAGCLNAPGNVGTDYRHGHHVAVEFGENRIWGSELLGECYVHWREKMILSE